MKRFEVIDHPSDVGIIAYGRDMKELFENAAFGMFSLMADVGSVRPKVRMEIRVSGDDRESLLVNWLNELIFEEDAKKLLFSEFKVKELAENNLHAIVGGERIDPSRHGITRSVKAATYNQLEISREGGGWKTKFVFDV